MIDNIKLANYKSFFADQVKEAIDEQQKINRSQMRNLFKTGELSLAYVDSIQHETGMIILKCPRRMAPRLKVLKGVCIIKKGAKQALGEHVTEWICRWDEFVDNKDFHSSGSDMTPMYYVHTGDSNYDYVACSGFSFKLYDILSKALVDGKSLSLIVHNPFPPVEYFRNLASYMDAFSSNDELNLEPTIDYEEWTPEELAFDEQKPTGISDTIIDTLANEHCCIVQGPPGTGKTLLAKAVAGEAGVPFFSISGSDFVEMYVGVGASRVRDLFDKAKKSMPCIIFIDEIDAVGRQRGAGLGGGHDEREQTLNQLLTEMDGFEGNTGVIILAATNRPESLDPALTRPGRFDRRVPVELPDLKGREEILKVHAKKVALAPGIDFTTVARMASGASGAELANIVNEAALRAVRAGRKSVTQSDLEESIEVVIAGYQKKNSILTDHEKCIVAYHEIGHALVAAKQTHSAPVQKITIIPRTSGALGYTMQVDEGNHYLMNKEELENKIATLTGGRAAEEVVFHSITTGASNDIEQATKLARAMLTRYGMSDEFDMVALETVNNQYLGGDTSLACSAQTQCEIDQKVVELVKAQHAKAVQILTDNRAKLDELAQYLYQKETITGEEFMEILNREG